MKELRIVAISDTHNRHNDITIPKCDILISAGDYSLKGYDGEIKRFYKWLSEQPARYVVSIDGNHEVGAELSPKNAIEIAKNECPNVILLNNKKITIEGVNLYGMPDTPYFFNWAYNRARNISEQAMYNIPLMKDYTDKLPENTNILITHGPAYGILDELLYANGDPKGQFVGCKDLLDRINIIKPDIHISGHIHCGYGEKHINGTSHYNVSICDERYFPSNPVTVIDYLTC